MKQRISRDILTGEDRHLWKRVTDSIKPSIETLSLTRGAFLKDEMARLMEESAPTDASLTARTFTSPLVPVMKTALKKPAVKPNESFHPMEDRLVKNLAKGRKRIDGRIDLHGMTQDRARSTLLDFLRNSQHTDHRIVLVITGKGNEGKGVLRHSVPQWLALPAFLSLVNGYREANKGHGGEGALYVRVRRRRL